MADLKGTERKLVRNSIAMDLSMYNIIETVMQTRPAPWGLKPMNKHRTRPLRSHMCLY